VSLAHARQCREGVACHHVRDLVRGDRPSLALVPSLDGVVGSAGAAMVAGPVCDRRLYSRCLLIVSVVGPAGRESAGVGLAGALCRGWALVRADAPVHHDANVGERRDRGGTSMMSHGIAAALDWLTDNRVALWLVAVLAGLAIHLIVWQFSEPSALFS